jgi:hypothetical protein
MAPPRTFDYELLKKLLKDHPEFGYAEYADALTKDARKTDRYASRILPGAVRRVVCQYRDTWMEEDGIQVPQRGVVYRNLLPPTGSVAPTQRMATPLRYLREIAKQRAGEAPVSENERIIRAAALRWEGRLRENREIADITELGIVEVRPARADELDGKGNLLELAAWALPGWTARPRRSGRGRG